MALSTRFDPELAHKLEQYCRHTGTTKSEVIRKSVEAFIDQAAKPATLYDLGKHLFGADKRPVAQSTSANVKQLLRAKLRAKHSR
jgi:hypothetical protein